MFKKIIKKTEKKTKKTSVLKAMASALMAILLCAAMAVPALAAPDYPNVIQGTESAPAQAGITKILNMPIGTPTPDAVFTFTFKKISYNANTTADDLKLIPDIGTPVISAPPAADDSLYSTKTITFSPADTTTAAGVKVEINGGIRSVIKETGNVLPTTWQQAGVYSYEVTEEATGFTPNTATGIIPDTMTYSNAKYKLTLWVESKADNSGFYVKYIAAEIIVNDIPGQPGGAKIDPTPGESNSSGKGYSQMIFTNTYLKNDGPINPPTEVNNAVLQISKTVTGIGSNQVSKYFTFNVTVNTPATVSTEETYKAYLYEYNNTSKKYEIVKTITALNAAAGIVKNDGTNDYVEFKVLAGSPSVAVTQQIQLKHNQILAFTNLPVGAPFTVKESDNKDYTPSCKLTAFSDKTVPGTIEKDIEFSAAMSAELLVPNTTAADSKFGNLAYIADETENKAAFTNAFKEITPTGISVDDLPYIILIAIVAIGIAGYIVIRVRKSLKNKA